jgi:hypothetical protein
MIAMALYLKQHRLKPDKVQDFIPNPMDLATCMYYTGLDPMSGQSVYVPRGGHERRLQRALLQYFKPENYADVREALLEADREDLIGDRPECLIPTRPPKTTSSPKRPPQHGQQKYHQEQHGQEQTKGGYRPHRKTARRRK